MHLFGLWLHVHQVILAAAESDFVAGVDARDLALRVERRGGGLKLAVAGVMRFHQLCGGAGHAGGALGSVDAGHVDRDGVSGREYAQMRHYRNVRMVRAVAARRNVDGQVYVSDLAVEHLLDAQAGVCDGDVDSVEVDRRNLQDSTAAHYAEAAKAGRALLALPLELIVFVDVPQVEWAAVFEKLPVGRVSLALERLWMEDRSSAESVVRVTAHVNIELAALGLRADTQVLERAANDAHTVALEVGEGDQHVGRRDCLSYIGFLQQVSLGDVHSEVGSAEPAVRADERAAQSRRVEAVPLGSQNEVELAGARAVGRVRRCRGVADERPASELLDPIRERSRIDRSQIGGVVPLATVNLYSYHVVGLDHLVEFSRVKDRGHLRYKARLSGRRVRVHPINFGLAHSFPPWRAPVTRLYSNTHSYRYDNLGESNIGYVACQRNWRRNAGPPPSVIAVR